MTVNLRHPRILDIARAEGRVTVDGLAESMGVAVQTIRRDLGDLAKAGHLRRVHGGAVLASGTENLAYEARRAMAAEAKRAIGAAAAARIPDRSAVFLGIGTTVEAVAERLMDCTGLMVVTNNLTVSRILSAAEGVEVIVSGGALRRSDAGLVGPIAMQALRQFRFDLAVMGCSALDPSGDILDFDVQEAGVNRTILAQSRGALLVADASKLERTAPVRIASLEEVATLVTDRALPDTLSQRCAAWGTEVLVAAAPGRHPAPHD